MDERVYDLDLCDDQQGGAGVIGLVTGKQDPLSVCSAAAGEWPLRRTNLHHHHCFSGFKRGGNGDLHKRGQRLSLHVPLWGPGGNVQRDSWAAAGSTELGY